ncbi:MAG: lipopolysaccharide biosynthesis protein [Mediterranea massiliensis]|nr:lipopolysaccharide biosynthesis protein [Mediterranea massiliensis]
MAGQSLKDKTAKGLFWGGLSNVSMQLLNLFFGIFLARLLTPADYGMVGMLTIFSLIAGSLQESGFIAALINRKEIRHDDYNAVFWFSISASLCIYTILYFCAPLIARFFNQPELTALARYSFLGFVISSTGVAQSAYLHKKLMVKQRAITSISALIVSGTVGVTLAYNGFSYWGIATQNIVYISVAMCFYWYFSPWRPTFTFDFRPIREMFSFSCKMLATNIFNHINNNIFSVILGKFYSSKDVGFYNQANKWNGMGHSLISGMINSVAHPILAQVSDDKERQLRIFRKMMRFTAFVSFPAMFGLSLIAPELIAIAITDKWAASAQILRLLCISGAFIPICGLCSNLVVSKGKSNIHMWCNISLGLLQLLVICFIYPYGIHTMIVTYVCINIAWLFVWYYFVHREIGYRFHHLLMDIVPFLLIALFSMLACYYLTRPITNIYLLFVGKIAIAASLYLVLMWLSGAQTFKESIGYFRKR